MNNEYLLFDKKNYQNKDVLWMKRYRNAKIGEEFSTSVGSPGYGHITKKVTRVDGNLVYGYEIENTVQIATYWDEK